MCEDHLELPERPTRRQLLVGTSIAAAGLALAAGRDAGAAPSPLHQVSAVPVRPGLSILPRDAWGADLPPKREIPSEDTKYLLVHHTTTPKLSTSTRTVIRNTYTWHTSATKGWADVCYNFFVGRDGQVWEGRAGSLDGPKRADATGGNQGFAQLVCLVGEFNTQYPTSAQMASLIKTLAHVGLRDGVDLTNGAKVTFTSRGSQRWPKGTSVTTPTVNGHRSMSYTYCPGNHVWTQMSTIRAKVAAQAAAWS